ncbi:MAG: peptide chain release factor N(5)-glutamine methyltransferase [Candidatus Binataceae bacterium]
MNSDATAERRTARRDAAAAIAAASARLARAGVESARLDAELLMAAAAGVSRATLIAGGAEIDAPAAERFERMVARREAREPLAYIVGYREFFSLELAVRPGVLIPRPETETVVEAALELLRRRPAATVLDIGTGSGAIAIAIAVHAPSTRIAALDISKVSLEVASDNARRHRCANRIAFLHGDCFAALEGSAPPFDPFDLIVSNPPYIAETEFATLAPEVRDFEPRLALEGDRDGIDFYRRIAAGLARWLVPGGEVILEVGAGQAEAVEAMMRVAGWAANARTRDLAGVDRVVRARRA